MQVSSAQAYQAAQGLTMGCIQVGILNTILLAGRGHLDRHVNVLQAQGSPAVRALLAQRGREWRWRPGAGRPAGGSAQILRK